MSSSIIKRLVSVPLAVATVAALAATPAFALTNNQPCYQVQEEFAQRGRVTTRSHSGAILPIYGGVPYLVQKSLYCGPSSTVYKQYVISADKRRCPVSQRCV